MRKKSATLQKSKLQHKKAQIDPESTESNVSNQQYGSLEGMTPEIAAFNKFMDKVYSIAGNIVSMKSDPSAYQDEPQLIAFKKQPPAQAEGMSKPENYNSGYLNEPWRFCVFPYHPINYLGFCKNTESVYGPKKVVQCQLAQCRSCCMFQKLSLTKCTQNIVEEESLQITDSMLNNAIGPDQVNECEQACMETYKPDDFPNPTEKPIPDGGYGATPKQPYTLGDHKQAGLEDTPEYKENKQKKSNDQAGAAASGSTTSQGGQGGNPSAPSEDAAAEASEPKMQPAKCLVTKEGKTANINCPGKIAKFELAIWGQLISNCNFKLGGLLQKDVKDKIQHCVGQTSCSVKASNSLKGDPCPFVPKTLKISYVCYEQQ